MQAFLVGGGGTVVGRGVVDLLLEHAVLEVEGVDRQRVLPREVLRPAITFILLILVNLVEYNSG